MAEFVTEADIDIICEVNSDQQEKEKIPAHSAILSNASPVFAAMFTHGMLEKTTKQIEVHVTKEEWTMFYNFLHPATGRLQKVHQDTVDVLLPLFDELQLTVLVNECEEPLLRMPVSVDRLLQAEKYNLEKQYRRSLRHFAKTGVTVEQTDELAKEPKVMAGLLPLMSVEKSKMSVEIVRLQQAVKRKQNLEALIRRTSAAVYDKLPSTRNDGIQIDTWSRDEILNLLRHC